MKLDVRELIFGPFGNSEESFVELFKEEIDEGIVAERTKLKLKITKLENEILAKFEGESKVTLDCDRCLNKFQLEIPLKFTQEYVLGGILPNENQMSIEKDMKINILEPLWQEIIVRLPIKKICKTDCAGICIHCGKNLNENKCICKSKSD